jgi:hypothetical protein
VSLNWIEGILKGRWWASVTVLIRPFGVQAISRPYSDDLRERVIEAVEAGRRGAKGIDQEAAETVTPAARALQLQLQQTNNGSLHL